MFWFVKTEIYLHLSHKVKLDDFIVICYVKIYQLRICTTEIIEGDNTNLNN